MTEGSLEPDEPERSGQGGPAGRLLVQFFVIPLFIVAIAVTVFWLFGRVATEDKSPVQLLSDVKTGSRNARWQAAFELTRRLPPASDPVTRAAFAEEVVRVYQGAEHDDPRVRRYLALLLGRLGDPKAVPLLQGALEDKDPETRLYALWALALIGDRASAPKVRPYLESEDPGLRKTAAYASGRFGDAEAAPLLKKLLTDEVVDVRWNTALALAQLGDPAGREILRGMVDRARLAQVPGLSGEQQDEAILNGLKGLTLLKDPEAPALAEKLQKSDPSLRVRRDAAGAVAVKP